MKIYILSIPSLLFYRISSPSSSHTPHPSSFIHYLLFLLTHARPPPPPSHSPSPSLIILPRPSSLLSNLSILSSLIPLQRPSFLTPPSSPLLPHTSSLTPPSSPSSFMTSPSPHSLIPHLSFLFLTPFPHPPPLPSPSLLTPRTSLFLRV